MTSSTQSALKLRLKNIDLFLVDAKNIQNYEDKQSVIKKYEGTEFYDGIQYILTARNAYQKVLVECILKKININKQLTEPVTEVVQEPVVEIKKSTPAIKNLKKK